ncbi:MAG: hypothetical protein CL861_02125 [Cyanobium sp. MED843]|nr:hypothetical protein [Cyanobium sp. MED843]
MPPLGVDPEQSSLILGGFLITDEADGALTSPKDQRACVRCACDSVGLACHKLALWLDRFGPGEDLRQRADICRQRTNDHPHRPRLRWRDAEAFSSPVIPFKDDAMEVRCFAT